MHHFRLIRRMTILLLSWLLLSGASYANSSALQHCLAESESQPKLTACFDAEISRQTAAIEQFLAQHQPLISPEDGKLIDLKAYVAQQLALIAQRCDLWLKSGGQNGQLLQKQCFVDEMDSLTTLLHNFSAAVEL